MFTDSSDKLNQNELGTDAFPTGQVPNDTELRDFSDDMDLDALGALLGTDAPFGGDSVQQMQEPLPDSAGDKKKKGGKEKKSGSFFAGLAAKFGGRKKKEKKKKDEPSLPEGGDISGFDFTYKPYTEEEITGDLTGNSSMTDSPFEQSPPFEERSPFEQSSPFEERSPFEQSSPFEERSPFEQSSPFEADAFNSAVPPFDNTSPDFTENGEGALLDDSLAPPLPEQSEPTPRKRERKKGLADSLNALFDAISDKFGSKKKKENLPPEKDFPPNDPNYVSETVRLVDIDDNSHQLTESQPALFGNPMGENPVQPPAFGNSLESNPTPMPPFGNSLESNPSSMPPFGNSSESNPSSMPPFGSPLESNPASVPPFGNPSEENPATTIPFGGTVEGEMNPPLSETPSEALSGEAIPENVEISVEDTAQEPPADSAKQERSYDIIGAVRARLQYLGKRLPSFKPKVYTIPESTYEPIDDNIKSPSLMADVEEYLRKRNFLGVVELEYDEMRDYLNSVDTEVRLSPDDIRPPANAQAVHEAENELFDLINEISAQNEQQRRQIGVYAPPPAQDPYNYRGINDERLYYTDMESSSFSMQPHVSFESVQKIDPNRAAKEEQYYQMLHEQEEQKEIFGKDFEDDFDDAFDDDVSYNGFEDDFEDDFDEFDRRNLSRARSRGGDYDGFDDDFDDDWDNDWDDRRSAPSVRSSTRQRGRRGDGFNDELAEDFDRNFTAPRVSARDGDRKPKRVAVRRRGGETPLNMDDR